MSPKGTLFFDEWQACLRAHYLYVLRTGDLVTESTLRRVLRHSGLTEEDIAALHHEAEVEPAVREEVAPPPAPLPEPEETRSTWDDDEVLQGDDRPDDVPPIPDGPPPPSQLTLF